MMMQLLLMMMMVMVELMAAYCLLWLTCALPLA
jgi:hypothetical protein